MQWLSLVVKQVSFNESDSVMTCVSKHHNGYVGGIEH